MQALQPIESMSRMEHRSYSVPAGLRALFMGWHDLLFMH